MKAFRGSDLTRLRKRKKPAAQQDVIRRQEFISDGAGCAGVVQAARRRVAEG